MNFNVKDNMKMGNPDTSPSVHVREDVSEYFTVVNDLNIADLCMWNIFMDVKLIEYTLYFYNTLNFYFYFFNFFIIISWPIL